MPTTLPGIANISAMRPLPTLSRIARMLALWDRRRRTRLAVRQLDDRLLRDIGLTPGHARTEAAKPFWRG